MAMNMREVNTTYAVQLSIMANSFYDPYSKANLFKTKPYYLFNHAPTDAILVAVKTGRLIDLKGNIKAMINGTPVAATQSVDVEAIEKKIRTEIESEIRAEFEAKYADKAEKLEAEYAKKLKALEASEVTEVPVEEVPADKEVKKAGKGKSSDK